MHPGNASSHPKTRFQVTLLVTARQSTYCISPIFSVEDHGGRHSTTPRTLPEHDSRYVRDLQAIWDISSSWS